MNRLPQKFRSWNKVRKEFATVVLSNEGQIRCAFTGMNITDCFIINFQVGITDETGLELYFDDILEDENGSRAVLVWNQDCLGLASGAIGNYHAIDRVRASELKTYTKVGNIYENPEMVQGSLFSKGRVFYSKHFVNRPNGSPQPITVEEVKPNTNELMVSWGRDNLDIWDLQMCENGIQNGDYYF